MEGDVDPLRDMQIIQKELQLKDIEWVEKSLENARKTGRALGTSSLAGRQRAEEIVSNLSSQLFYPLLTTFKATQERILKLLKEDGKDVRKGEWNNKEVGPFYRFSFSSYLP